MYQYRAKVLRVIDGDTIDVAVDLGFRVSTVQRIRLAGLDTAELRSADLAKRALATKALEYVSTWAEERASDVVIHSQKPGGGDKYGRWIAEVWSVDGKACLNASLLIEGLATPYDGGAKEP